MSYFESQSPACYGSSGVVDLIVRPVRKNLGEFSVARALPAPERQMIGPFIFFDHMGPAEFAPGQGIQVRPHPHIGIATITYLFEGLILHRDSLGYVQAIEPGAVNLMLAGRGIVHSERAGDDLNLPSRLHGIQSWLALPDADLECDPAFTHYAAAEIPEFKVGDAILRLIIGDAFGRTSPVTHFVATLYLEVRLPAGARVEIPADVPELAAYVVSGRVGVGDSTIEAGEMAVARPATPLVLEASLDSLVMVIGGAPVGSRHLWWNFVAPTMARIEQAKSDWRNGRFPAIDGDDEFIPLPDD
jgi:hypothetical protein